MLPTLIALAVSTTLNAIYFLRMVITLYARPASMEKPASAEKPARSSIKFRTAIFCFVLLNLALGLFSQPIVQAIADGLAMFD